jgi:hypothetical protein
VDFVACGDAATGFALVVAVPGCAAVTLAPKRFRHLLDWGAALMQVASSQGRGVPPPEPPAAEAVPSRPRRPLLLVPSQPRRRSPSTPPAPLPFPVARATTEALAHAGADGPRAAGARPMGRLTPPMNQVPGGGAGRAAVGGNGSSLYPDAYPLGSAGDYYMVPQARGIAQIFALSDAHASAGDDRSQRGGSLARQDENSCRFHPIRSRVSQSLGRPESASLKNTAPLNWAQAYRIATQGRRRRTAAKATA